MEAAITRLVDIFEVAQREIIKDYGGEHPSVKLKRLEEQNKTIATALLHLSEKIDNITGDKGDKGKSLGLGSLGTSNDMGNKGKGATMPSPPLRPLNDTPIGNTDISNTLKPPSYSLDKGLPPLSTTSTTTSTTQEIHNTQPVQRYPEGMNLNRNITMESSLGNLENPQNSHPQNSYPQNLHSQNFQPQNPQPQNSLINYSDKDFNIPPTPQPVGMPPLEEGLENPKPIEKKKKRHGFSFFRR